MPSLEKNFFIEICAIMPPTKQQLGDNEETAVGECVFYHEERKIIKSREIRADRQVNAIVKQIPWCAHMHSPVSKEIATAVIGGGNLLSCGGSLAKCQVPLEKRGDLDQ